MVRLRHWQRNADFSSSDEQAPLFQQLWKRTIISEQFETLTGTMSIGAGIRYAYTFYVGITYVFALGERVNCDPAISYSNGTKDYKTTSLGYQFGAGIDFGILPYVGIFIEYAYGYATLEFPNGKKYNGDSQPVYIGASFCTSYGLIE
jgi:hypothetical protein